MAQQLSTIEFEDVPLDEARRMGRGPRMDPELYHALKENIQSLGSTASRMPLPDGTRVFPAHGAGSLCGKAISRETTSTMGEQRRSNYALQPMPKETFVELITADQPDAPPYFTYDAVLNTKERPTLDETLVREVQPLALDHVLALQSVGGQVLDTRDANDRSEERRVGKECRSRWSPYH